MLPDRRGFLKLLGIAPVVAPQIAAAAASEFKYGHTMRGRAFTVGQYMHGMSADELKRLEALAPDLDFGKTWRDCRPKFDNGAINFKRPPSLPDGDVSVIAQMRDHDVFVDL